jgi:hypothetical protein
MGKWFAEKELREKVPLEGASDAACAGENSVEKLRKAEEKPDENATPNCC